MRHTSERRSLYVYVYHQLSILAAQEEHLHDKTIFPSKALVRFIIVADHLSLLFIALVLLRVLGVGRISLLVEDLDCSTSRLLKDPDIWKPSRSAICI